MTNWDEMEAVWEYCLEDKLHVDTASTHVFLTEPLFPHKNTRETTVETMFELFNVAGVYLHVQPVLALYASGSTSGLVIDCGESCTSVIPVCEGYQLANSCVKMSTGGYHLSSLLLKLISLRDSLPLPQYTGHSQSYVNLLLSQRGRSPMDVARRLKEKYGFCVDRACDDAVGNQWVDPASEVEYLYELPDGQPIILGSELARCGEAMFRPLLSHDVFDVETEKPLHAVILDAVRSCSLDMRKTLLSNVLLAGGGSQLRGLDRRLCEELRSRVPAAMTSSVQVTHAPGGDESVWRGGAVLTSMPSFTAQWISADDYFDNGADIVHQMCPVYL